MALIPILPTLRVVSNPHENGLPHTARHMRVFLGDQDISHFTSKIELTLDASSGDPVCAILTLHPGNIEFELPAEIRRDDE